MKSVRIDENTQLPAKLVISALGVTIGFVFWLTTMSVNQSAMGSEFQEFKGEVIAESKERRKNREDYIGRITRIESSLERIENKLGTKGNR